MSENRSRGRPSLGLANARQIALTLEQDDQLKQLSNELDIPIVSLVRSAVQHYLNETTKESINT